MDSILDVFEYVLPRCLNSDLAKGPATAAVAELSSISLDAGLKVKFEQSGERLYSPSGVEQRTSFFQFLASDVLDIRIHLSQSVPKAPKYP